MINFAIIEDTVVTNIAICESIEIMEAIYPSATIKEVTDDLRCVIGNYYNESDGKYYDDAEFTSLSGSTNADMLVGGA